MTINPGPVVLLGSGETSPNIRKVYDELFGRLDVPVRTAILETPAGFEPNSSAVAQQIGTYLSKRLQNYRPQVSVLPARKKGTCFSPDEEDILSPMYGADVIIMGPGSPTYTVRQLHDSLAWYALQACHRLGATVIFASAATLASSLQTLPVYEIYKVGEDLHWKPGLNFFGVYGLNLVFFPHWNNNDGGHELDTSHCYIGTGRYNELVDMLPDLIDDDYTIVGIDENTALVVEPSVERCMVRGPGSVVIIRGNDERRFASGETFSASELGPFRLPNEDDGIPASVWHSSQRLVEDVRSARAEKPHPPTEILVLTARREEARAERDWTRADSLRDAISKAGWDVRDTSNGPLLEPLE